MVVEPAPEACRAQDPNYPVEFSHVIDELKTAKAPFEVKLYSRTAHGFSRPNNKAEERAITQAKAASGARARRGTPGRAGL
jgi:dienelactone hydrolase